MQAKELQSREQLRGQGADTDKRRAIIEAARELFTTQGYEATTMAQVAAHAGVAVGTVYLYFKNKSDLLVEVKGDWEREVLGALTSPELTAIPYHLRARPLIEAAFEICARHTNMVQLMGVQAELVGEWSVEAPAPIHAALKSFLDEGVALGALRGVNTEIAAVGAFGLVNGALLQCFVVEQGARQEDYIEMVLDALTRWLLNPDLLSR